MYSKGILSFMEIVEDFLLENPTWRIEIAGRFMTDSFNLQKGLNTSLINS